MANEADRLVDLLCELSPGQRVAWFEANATEPELRRRVERVLEHFDSALAQDESAPELNFDLGEAIREATDEAGDVPSGAAPLPAAIGAYEVTGLVGSGGMGVVYSALQKEPRREVAIKVLRSGLLSAEFVRRFEQEAELLGRLRHPGIARVIELGRTPDDDPALSSSTYLVMELVDGRPVTEYADREALDVGARLGLILKLADAVHHAHLRGVVHRDLKPANVLVSRDGRIHVIDFGVARALDREHLATMQTSAGQVIGTLAYMAPEQARGQVDEIDARADVYALGVMTYELLGGVLPHDLTGLAIMEATRVISEVDALPLGRHTPACDRDLELIVAKALEKEPPRRYPSAEAFAADIRRYQSHLPIVARPPSTIYQLRKFARRNPTLVAGAVAAVISLVIGLVSTWIYAARAVDAAQQARLEADTSERIAAFLTGMFREQDPDRAQGERVTVKEVLDRESARIGDSLEEEPWVRSRLMAVMGDVYRSLGLHDEAEPLLEEVLAIRRAHLGEEAPATLDALGVLGALRLDQARFDEAKRLIDRELEIRTRRSGITDPGTRRALRRQADLLEMLSRYDEAEALILEMLGTPQRGSERDRADELNLLARLAGLQRAQGRFGEAERTHIRAIEGRSALLGPDAFNTMASRHDRALVLIDLNRIGEAETELLDVADWAQRVLGPEHPSTVSTRNSLGSLFLDTGRFERAEQEFAAILEIDRRLRGEDHPSTILAMHNLATAISAQDRTREALELEEGALQRSRELFGDEHRMTLRLLKALSDVVLRDGDPERALKLLNEALGTQQRRFGADHPDVLGTLHLLGRIQIQMDRLDEAEATCEEVVAGLRALHGEESRALIPALYNLAAVYERAGRFDEHREAAFSAIEMAYRLLGPDHPDTGGIAEDARQGFLERGDGDALDRLSAIEAQATRP